MVCEECFLHSGSPRIQQLHVGEEACSRHKEWGFLEPPPPRPKATADRRQHTPTARGEDASAPHIEPFGYREYGPIMFLRMGGSSWVVASSTSAADAFLRGKDLTICSCSCSPTISGTSRECPTDRIGVT